MDEWEWGCARCVLGTCRQHHTDICAQEGCDRTAFSGFFCPTHYRHKRVGRLAPVRRYGSADCHCGAPHYAKGLCRRHYRSASIAAK